MTARIIDGTVHDDKTAWAEGGVLYILEDGVERGVQFTPETACAIAASLLGYGIGELSCRLARAEELAEAYRDRAERAEQCTEILEDINARREGWI